MWWIWSDSDKISKAIFFLVKLLKKHIKMHKIIKYISTCNHLHIGMYDTMNHCRKFEEILMRTWLEIWFNLKL